MAKENPKMKNDCELCSFKPEETVFSNDKWRVIQVNDADYPGFCRVIWNGHVREMTDLSEAERFEMMTVVWTVEKVVREIMQADKINLASFGNMVPHLHWHVIPRFENDRHFPDSIWAAARRVTDVHATCERTARASGLKEALIQALHEQFSASESVVS